MRIKLMIFVFSVLMLAATVTHAFCETLEVSGVVDQTNVKFSTIVVLAKDAGGFNIFTTDSKTTISKAGKNLKFEDVKKGDFVTVTYETMDNKNSTKKIARSVIISDPKKSIVPSKKKK